ncbi:YolD-like family protein [Paenibacillus tritici]|uniref:YolD-like family protein n=1 Tax=Paenibacillus tritici TaxID=1873425 RepID=A0ABX2DIJ3_9BACL|nr:YolD-like family protein [Paenibacillus tritici]NQX44439.1 YolD-like family protein [Paenibacillus tritici]QUL53520.1 YolD-like family protein [Paenibacillus tritici]
MGKKLEAGSLRESSRILLTEHKSGIRRDEREAWRSLRPVLDEQKVEEIEHTLALSLRSHVRVTVVLFDPLEQKLLSGFVTSIHTHSREIKLQWAEEWKWLLIDDIVEAYIV